MASWSVGCYDDVAQTAITEAAAILSRHASWEMRVSTLGHLSHGRTDGRTEENWLCWENMAEHGNVDTGSSQTTTRLWTLARTAPNHHHHRCHYQQYLLLLGISMVWTHTHTYNSLDRSFFLVIDGDGLTDSSRKERGRWTILILLDGFHFQSLSSLRVQSSPVQFTTLFLSLFFSIPNSQVAQRDDRRVACPCVNKFWRLNTKARRSWVMQFNISLSRLF